MPTFDAALMFISSGNVTGSADAYVGSAVKIQQTSVRGMAARIIIPAWPGTSARVLPLLYASADNSTYRILAAYPGGPLSQAKSTSGNAKEYIIPFAGGSKVKYVKLYFDKTTATTGSSWGAVKAGVVLRAHQDWERLTDFQA